MTDDKPQRRRRGHGEGAIGLYKDGRWVARIDLGIVEGKRKRKAIYGKTRKEVAEKLKVALREQQQGVNIAPKQQTLGKFLDEWLANVVSQSRRPTTHEIYSYAVKRIKKHIAHIQLAKLTAQHVQGMLTLLAADGYSPTTIDRARDVLINALNQAMTWELVSRNVAKQATPPKVEPYQPRVLSQQEAQKLLTTAAGDRLGALYRVGLSLGLRRGEVLGLRWDDIDFEAKTLQVANNLQLIGGKLVLVPPKTKESRRTLSLSPRLISALREHKARQLLEQMVAGASWKGQNLVFCTSIGTPIAPRNLLRSYKALLGRAGLPDMRFHDLRHSFVTLLLAQGESLKVVQELAGHSDPRITQQIYQHVTSDQKRQAVVRMDALLEANEEVG
jgi:integrase